MGATVQTMTLVGMKTGQVYNVSLYFAGGDAAGYRVPASQYLAAAATSNPRFVIPEPCVIRQISGPATGTMRLLADGAATPILLNTAQILASVANPNAVWGQLRGIAADGHAIQYELAVEVAMAA
jgi:hypothetical protein